MFKHSFIYNTNMNANSNYDIGIIKLKINGT